MVTLLRRDSGYYGWEARDRRMPKGRISISLRTKDRVEAKRRVRALDLLLERGEVAVLQRLRSGDLHISQVASAVKAETVDELRGTVMVDLSLGAMIDRAMTTKQATRSPGTIKVYRGVTTAMLGKWGRDVSLTRLSTDELRAWLYEPKGERRKPWAPNSQARVAMVAGYLWRLAIEAETEAAERLGIKPRLTRNPWDRIEASDRASPRKSFLEPYEWRDVLAQVRGRPPAALLALGCLAGLRAGEVLNLRTRLDVDFAAGLIRVQSRDGEYAWRPKHANSQRDVPMTASLREVLEAHVASGFAGDRYFIHAARWDRPMAYNEARKWTAEAFGRAGLKYGREGESLTNHSLRHTFASLLVREGWSSSLVAKLLGNTAAEVDRTYSHLYPTDLTKVVATLDRLVGV